MPVIRGGRGFSYDSMAFVGVVGRQGIGGAVGGRDAPKRGAVTTRRRSLQFGMHRAAVAELPDLRRVNLVEVHLL